MDIISPLLANKRIRIILFAIVALMSIYFIYSYLTNGYLTVATTDPNNTISLLRKKGSGKPILIASKQARLSVSVPSGSYEVLLTNRTLVTSKTVNIKGHSSSNYKIDLPSSINAESVLPFGTSSLTASSSDLVYLDYNSLHLYKLDASGIWQIITPQYSFLSVQWASPSFGVGQTKNQELFIISNGLVTPLITPFSYKTGTAVSYSVSPSGVVYVSYGNIIYAGQKAESFKELYKTASNYPALFAGNDSVAVIDTFKDDDKELKIIGQNGLMVSKKIDISNIAWAPDGKKIVATGQGNGSDTVYSSSLTKIADLPGDASNNVLGEAAVWVDNNAVTYGRSSSLWEYNTDTGDARVLTTTPNHETITNVFLNQDKSFVYFTGEDLPNSSNILLRVGLTPETQKAPSYYSGLSILLPSTTDQCSFTYSNFLKPYLIINGWNDQAFCINAARALLNNSGLPASGFSIIFGPSRFK